MLLFLLRRVFASGPVDYSPVPLVDGCVVVARTGEGVTVDDPGPWVAVSDSRRGVAILEG